jgi:hypothetical protein
MMDTERWDLAPDPAHQRSVADGLRSLAAPEPGSRAEIITQNAAELHAETMELTTSSTARRPLGSFKG